MFNLRHFIYHINNETLRTEVHFYHFERISASHRCSFWVILSQQWIHKIPNRGSFLFSFSASQLRTAVHIWPFGHHIEFETLRIEVHFCSFIAHLSFAPKFIFGHFWSCTEAHFWLFLVILSLYLCIYVRYVSLSVRTYVCMFLRMYVCMYVWSSPNFTPSLSKRFDYRRKAGCFCPSPAQRVDVLDGTQLCSYYLYEYF